MLELAVTAACCDQAPPVALEHTKDFADLHGGRIAGDSPVTPNLFSYGCFSIYPDPNSV
jgi:hypothetical protein